ncbi:MAG: DUF1963 domain-containing protein [Woeseiaceae bacterium]|nr:DUF1963 domain-containing protein [Woeseiaceae bacterium]
MKLSEAKELLARRAIQFEIGGFRPPENPNSSWFGAVNLATPEQSWPESNGKPMHALCQINIADLPFRTPGLEDIDFLSVFIGPDELPSDELNGTNWCLRTYRAGERLVALEQVDSGSVIRPFPMRPIVIEEDFPMWEDVEIDLFEQIAGDYYDHFDNVGGLKLGGWPTLIQSEIFWAPWNKHPANPRYVFQIDSTEKGNWTWGDSGVGYFGRGTAQGYTDEWACEWQCY